MAHTLYYDGECPFCSRFARYLRIKECFDLELVDAASDFSWKQLCPGLDIDEGVILYDGSKCLQGEKALRKLYNTCPKKGLFWKIQRGVFDTPLLGRLVYALAKTLRKIVKKEN